MKGYCRRGHLIEGERVRNGVPGRFCIVCKNQWRQLRRRRPSKITDHRINELAGILADQYFIPLPIKLRLSEEFR